MEEKVELYLLRLQTTAETGLQEEVKTNKSKFLSNIGHDSTP